MAGKQIFQITVHHDDWKGQHLIVAEDDIEARRIAVGFDQDPTDTADPEEIDPLVFCEVEWIGTVLEWPTSP